MALMMIMRVMQEQTQCVSEGMEGIQPQEQAGETDAFSLQDFLQGGQMRIEAFDRFRTQASLSPALLSELKDAIQAYLGERQATQNVPAGTADRAGAQVLPEPAAVTSGGVPEGFSDTQANPAPLLKQHDAAPGLDAVLGKLGLEPDQILRIKSHLSKEPETVAAAESVKDTPGKPVFAGITKDAAAETASGPAQTRSRYTEPGSTQPVSGQPAGQTAQVSGQDSGGEAGKTEGAQADIFAQLVEKAAAGIQEGKYRMSIQLRPEHLGKVSIQLAMDADGLVVRIHPQNDAVESAISNQLIQLEQALKDKGITVARMEVAQENLQNGTGHSGNANDGQKQRRKAYDTSGDDARIEAAGREMYMTLQPFIYGNSVEFQA